MDRPLLAAEFQPARRVNAVARRLADAEKAKRLLGFSAATPLRQGLQDLLSWWREQRPTAPALLEDQISR
jgi:UDP-glucose 4-epimerase